MGKVGKNSNRTVCFTVGDKKYWCCWLLSCNAWKADGFLWTLVVRPSTPSSTMQPLACKSSLKVCQGVQLNQAAALLAGSEMCYWLKLKPCWSHQVCFGARENCLWCLFSASCGCHLLVSTPMTWICIVLSVCLLLVGGMCKHLMSVLWLPFKGNQFERSPMEAPLVLVRFWVFLVF